MLKRPFTDLGAVRELAASSGRAQRTELNFFSFLSGTLFRSPLGIADLSGYRCTVILLVQELSSVSDMLHWTLPEIMFFDLFVQ